MWFIIWVILTYKCGLLVGLIYLITLLIIVEIGRKMLDITYLLRFKKDMEKENIKIECIGTSDFKIIEGTLDGIYKDEHDIIHYKDYIFFLVVGYKNRYHLLKPLDLMSEDDI